MRQKAKKLFAKICCARGGKGCINLIMKAFEDVAVNFAWEMLVGYGCNNITIDQIKAGFRDYALPVPFRPTLNYDKMDSYYQYDMMKRLSKYPPYKTQVEIVRESMEKYMSKYPTRRYYKCLYCDHSFLDVGKARCPRCESIHLAHMTQAGYDKERAKKQNYIQANKHLHGISRYYKCRCCDHTFLSVSPRYCPECKSITFIPLSRYEKERERIRKQISKYYHKCPYCELTYLGSDYCPRCEKDREKFLNTYGYVARPGLDLDEEKSYTVGQHPFPWHRIMEEGIKKLTADKQTPSLREQGFYSAQDVCDNAGREKGLPVGYISYEDMDYLWKHMPNWVKQETPLYPKNWGPPADQKIRKEIKRILRRI